MYASNGVNARNNQIIRIRNIISVPDTTVMTINALIGGSNANATAFKVSPYTLNRVYVGGDRGKLVRIDQASTVNQATVTANLTDISSPSFPATGFLNCINTGSSDNYLVAVFTNYGVNNVWYSSNGGTSWSAIDGTFGAGGLPDMPVRWAIFNPQDDDKLMIATDAGIYTTDDVDGANTVWNA